MELRPSKDVYFENYETKTTVFVSLCRRAYICVCVCVCVCVHCTYVYIYVHMCMYVYICVHMCTYYSCTCFFNFIIHVMFTYLLSVHFNVIT